MANGEYNAKSAYAAQFVGSYADYEWNKVWQAKVEEKCKFFYWLFIQNKVWTTDRITKHGGTTNTVCQLYYTQPESLLHMLAQCLLQTDLDGAISMDGHQFATAAT
jgi:hypothetical protein